MTSSSNGPPSTVGQRRILEQPDVDGVLSIVGPHGKSILQLALSGESNSAHLTLRVGQRLYTLDIQPIRGLDMSGWIAEQEKKLKEDEAETRRMNKEVDHLLR
jgi:hypothetical protein